MSGEGKPQPESGLDPREQPPDPRADGKGASGTDVATEAGIGERDANRDDRADPDADDERTGDLDADDDDDDQAGDDDLDADDLSAWERARVMYRSQPLAGRMKTAGAAAFILLFLSMMLVRGLNDKYREPLWPLIGWYTDGLGMARSWGMFAHPSTELPIFIYGKTKTGEEIQLSPPLEDSLWIRIRDQRMRKIRAHMGNEDTRKRWGRDLLRYMCRAESTEGRKLRSVRLVEIGRMNAGEGKELLDVRCWQ